MLTERTAFFRTSCQTSLSTTRGKRQLQLPRPQQSQPAAVRPMTTPLRLQKAYETLNTTGKSSHLMNMKSINVVENELETQYSSQLNEYLRKKLRNLVGKKQEDIACRRYNDETLEQVDPEATINSYVGPLDQFYATFSHPKRLKVEKGVDQAYVTNAKEHIHRMIHKKRQQQGDFKQLKRSIETRQSQRRERRGKSVQDDLKVSVVHEKPWDLQWFQSAGKQKKRYRNRLLHKWKKQNKESWLCGFKG